MAGFSQAENRVRDTIQSIYHEKWLRQNSGHGRVGHYTLEELEL